MSDWIEVNGAKIEKTFLEENVQEAKSYHWVVSELPLSEHTHCIICGIAMPDRNKREQGAYRSPGGWVDAYCYQRFVVGKMPNLGETGKR